MQSTQSRTQHDSKASISKILDPTTKMHHFSMERVKSTKHSLCTRQTFNSHSCDGRSREVTVAPPGPNSAR